MTWNYNIDEAPKDGETRIIVAWVTDASKKVLSIVIHKREKWIVGRYEEGYLVIPSNMIYAWKLAEEPPPLLEDRLRQMANY